MLVTERELVMPDGSVIQAGTITDAAAACGIKMNSYFVLRREYGAPGPILVPDPVTGEPIPYVFPGTRAEAYDINAVREWRSAQVGKGYRPPESLDELRRTPLRVAVLVDAEAGRITLDESGRLDTSGMAAALAVGKRPVVVVTALRNVGALEPDDGGRRLVLSVAGGTLLERFRREAVT